MEVEEPDNWWKSGASNSTAKPKPLTNVNGIGAIKSIGLMVKRYMACTFDAMVQANMKLLRKKRMQGTLHALPIRGPIHPGLIGGISSRSPKLQRQLTTHQRSFVLSEKLRTALTTQAGLSQEAFSRIWEECDRDSGKE